MSETLSEQLLLDRIRGIEAGLGQLNNEFTKLVRAVQQNQTLLKEHGSRVDKIESEVEDGLSELRLHLAVSEELDLGANDEG